MTVRQGGMSKELELQDEFYFQWHITNRCNLRCAHCYHDSYAQEDEMDLPELKNAFAEMEHALSLWGKTGTFSITGGEPFTRKAELFELANFMDASDLVGYYDILTNGFFIHDETVASLKELQKLRRIQVSLESPYEKENDEIRGKGSYKKILASIRKMKDAGFEVAVMMTVTRKNKESIPQTLALLADNAVDVLSFERFIPEGTGEQIAHLALSKSETEKFFKEVHSKGMKTVKPRVLMYRPLFALVDPDDPTVGAMCSIGVNALTIMPNGDILPCRRLPIVLGSMRTKNDIFRVWYESDLLWKVRDPESLAGCKGCELISQCRGCRAMAYLYCDNDYLARDPHCWR